MFLYVSSIVASLPPVSAHGKFLRRARGKFLLKAMRLPGVAGALDFSEKLTLRKRLDELAAAHVNALILTEAQAETVLGLAGQAGLCAMVEIAIDSNDFDSPIRARAAVARVAKVVNALRGHRALIGFLIDFPLDAGAILKLAPDALRGALDAIVRAVRAANSHLMVALKRRADAPALAIADEDLAYVSLAKIDPTAVGPAICALHDLAGAHPLVIEIDEELPGQEEVVARAFGFGAAGVVAPAMRPAASHGWQNIRMLSAGELLPFAHLDGSSVPLPVVTPMVSVVVAARDDERTIAACLESIGRLQYPNYEVIVIDDAAQDRSADSAADFPGVRLIRQPRAGFGAIRNVAVRAARGHLIAFTRADCVVDSDWLALAVRAMAEGGLDGCCGPIYSSPGERGLAARVLSSLQSTGSMRSSGDRVVQLTDRNMIMRKSSLIAVGGFDSRFIDAGGDLDLSARMIEAGMTLGWCPAGFVWRCGRNTIGKFFHQRIRHGRAEAMLAIKYPGRFGAAMTKSHRTADAGRFRLTRSDRVRAGVAVWSLSTVLSSIGAIARIVARCHYTVTAAGAVASTTSPSREANQSAHQVAIGNNHAHAVHPTGR